MGGPGPGLGGVECLLAPWRASGYRGFRPDRMSAVSRRCLFSCPGLFLGVTPGVIL